MRIQFPLRDHAARDRAAPAGDHDLPDAAELLASRCTTSTAHTIIDGHAVRHDRVVVPRPGAEPIRPVTWLWHDARTRQFGLSLNRCGWVEVDGRDEE